MDYTPFDPATLMDEAPLLEGAGGPGSSFPRRRRDDAGVLRYRGMVMNTLTGSILVHGRPARLAVKERELLATLMRRAGQIVSLKWLAAQLDTTIDDVDALAQDLCGSLREAGAQCLPRQVQGLGYVLWR